MDTGFITQFAPLYVEAGKLTIWIGFWGVVFAVVTGMICCLIQHYKLPVLRRLVGAYIELSRNTPLLVQLFFLYYGLPKIGIRLSGVACAIIGLTFLGGSYMAEAFRSGLQAVDKIQQDSALSLGMSHGQCLAYVTGPQGLLYAVPALCANVIFMIKETSVVSAIALADLMFVTKDLIGLYYQTEEALFLLMMAYLVILLPISLGAAWLERRMRFAGFGH